MIVARRWPIGWRGFTQLRMRAPVQNQQRARKNRDQHHKNDKAICKALAVSKAGQLHPRWKAQAFRETCKCIRDHDAIGDVKTTADGKFLAGALNKAVQNFFIKLSYHHGRIVLSERRRVYTGSYDTGRPGRLRLETCLKNTSLEKGASAISMVGVLLNST